MNKILDCLHNFLEKVFELCFFHYKKVWIFIVTLIVLLSFSIPNLKFLVMMSDLLDNDFKTYEQFENLNNDFIEENQVSVILSPKNEKLSLRDHCHIIKWLNKVVLTSKDIERVFSSYGLKEGIEVDRSFSLKPILIPDCFEKISQREIDVQLEKVKNSPSGLVLTSKDKNDVFASFYLKNLSRENKSRFGHYDKFAFTNLRDSFEKYVKSKTNNVEVQWVGTGTYQYYLQKAYEQMNVVNIITAIILILAFKLIIGTFKSGVILLSTYSIVTIVIYGFMSLLNYPVDSLSAAVPVMLLISTLEDFVFFLNKYTQSGKIKESFKEILIPSFYTSLTTCLGFLSLGLSELSIVRRFGYICAVGALIEWIIIFLVLPRILLIFKEKNNNELKLVQIPHFVTGFLRIFEKIKLKNIFSYLSLIPLIYLLFFFQEGLRINDSPEAVFPKNHPIIEATKKLLSSRGWKSEISLVFPKYLERSEQNDIAKKITQTVPELIGFESYNDVKNYLKENLKFEYSKNFIERNMKYSEVSKRWLSHESDHERILMYSNTTDVVRINEIREIVQSICLEKCYLASILVSYSEFGVKVLDTLTKSFGLTFVIIIIFLIILLVYFRVKQKFIFILSSIWGPLTLFAIFIFFDIGIYFATSVVMSVLVGLAGDNAFHFLFSSKGNKIEVGVKSLEITTIISLLLMLFTSVGFLFSDFEGVRKIGLIMIGGIFLGWFGDLVILKSFFKKS